MFLRKANRKSRLNVVPLFVASGILVFAASNNATQDETSSATQNQSESAARRAEAAAEKAEAAAKRAEEAAKRVEAATKQVHTQPAIDAQRGNSNLRTNSDASVVTAEDDELRDVRFTAAKKLVDFNQVERAARAWLTKNGHAPPTKLVAMFEVADEEIFVTVKYGERIGEPFWYVKFNRNFGVDEWGARILKAKE